jgi:hypothetical protein
MSHVMVDIRKTHRAEQRQQPVNWYNPDADSHCYQFHSRSCCQQHAVLASGKLAPLDRKDKTNRWEHPLGVYQAESQILIR